MVGVSAAVYETKSDVEFAVWRKKVDKSLIEHNGPTVPEWAT
jgi:hypothetical protein